MALKTALSLLALSSGVAADLPSIVMKGSKLFYPNGTQFFMKGVAYQADVATTDSSSPASSGSGSSSSSSSSKRQTSSTTIYDPLADETACTRDVPLLAALGTNIIRTYSIDPTQDHSACMKLLQDNGIYVISDLGSPNVSINREDPQWNVDLFQHYQQVVDSLSQYSNVVGFFAGNEVSNNQSNTGASAYVKAAARDTKAYIKQNVNRWMGVGYAANDDVDIRRQISDYFNCGNQTDAVDFWGYNIYSWCGQSNFADSGYNDQIEFFSNYSVPVFFAEYGCNLPNGAAGRIWEETTALYDQNMTEVFSGGIVYMYFEEANDYGLVDITNGKASKMKDYGTLQTKVLAAKPSGVEMSSYNPTNQPAACPALDADWQANSALPPTPDADLCSCMTASLSCVHSSSLSSSSYGKLFGYICGQDPNACKGISGNSSTGIYGAYSMCSASQQLDYALDQYYKSQNSASTACDFNGDAVVQKAASNSSCTSALASASSYNAQVATATAAVSGSSSGGSGNSSSDDSFAMPGARLMTVGNGAVGLYMIVSVIVGAAMVFV